MSDEPALVHRARRNKGESMSWKQLVSTSIRCLRLGIVSSMVVQLSLGGLLAVPVRAQEGGGNTVSPIQHVIVLIGENRTFDHLFATYVPKRGEFVKNLLSEGIVKADGTPGWNFKKSQQFQAVAPFRTNYFVSLNRNEKAPYKTLPQPTLN